MLLLLQTDHEALAVLRNAVRQTVCGCSELFDKKTLTPKLPPAGNPCRM